MHQMPENIPGLIYLFLVLTISVLAFFLIRYWYMVDEIRKDVKTLLIDQAAKNQLLLTLKEDVAEFKLRQQEYDKRLNYQQRELERYKKASD